MQELLNNMKTGYAAFTGQGQYVVLFFLAMLFLYVYWEKTKKNGQNFLGRKYMTTALVLTISVLFPVSAFLLLKYQTSYYSYSSLFMLLPMTGLTAYAFTEIVYAAEQYHRQQGSRDSLLGRHRNLIDKGMIAAAALLLFLCGSLKPGGEVTAMSQNSLKMPAAVLEILQEVPEGEIMAAPDTVVAYARQYNGKLLLLYGRNMGNPALNAYTYDKYDDRLTSLHEWLNPDEEELFNGACVGSSLPAEEAMDMMREYGCQVIILTRAQYDWEPVREAVNKQAVYEYGAGNAEYVMLLRGN